MPTSPLSDKHGVIRNCTSKGVDHAVLMVAAGTDDGVNYFTIKNSWSAKWGEAGYGEHHNPGHPCSASTCTPTHPHAGLQRPCRKRTEP